MIATPEEQRDQALRVEEALRQVLERQEAWHCNRVWEAWAVDTMGRDDFSLVTEDPIAIEELVQAAMLAFRAVQGEPNDDSERIGLFIEWWQTNEEFAGRDHRNPYLLGAAMVKEFPALSRATVPDAAKTIAELKEYSMRTVEHGLKVIDQRDAALAAIERVRAIHEPIPIYEGAESCGHTDEEHTTFESDQGIVLCEISPLGYSICGGCSDDSSADGPVEHPCPTIAALDGAPEPEDEPEEEMYQAGCGSWDCRAPECGKA